MIQNRLQLHKLLQKLKVKTGIELGVASGKYSKYLVDNHNFSKYYGVDKWNDHHNEQEKAGVLRRFSGYTNVEFLHMSFDDALTKFSDEYFDFIYIDGYAHTGQDGGNTIQKWLKKLKPGGLYAGHDYCEKRWSKTVFQVNSILRDELGYKIHITQEVAELENPEHVYPSWYIIK